MSSNPFVFREGDLPTAILLKSTIRVSPKSKYYLSLPWLYFNCEMGSEITPRRVIFGEDMGDIDVDFMNFMNVTTKKLNPYEMDCKNIVGMVRIMYEIDYKDRKGIWNAIPRDKSTNELALMVKKYDVERAADLVDHVDWGKKAEKEFLEEFEKAELVEVVLKMSKKKKRKTAYRSPSPC